MIVALTYDGAALLPLDPRDAEILSEEYEPGQIVSVDVKPAKGRSLQQNRLQHLWHREAAEQLKDETAEEKRAYCKLHFGIPILRAESEEFRDTYDRIIRPLSYENKLALMAAPIDFPCTRLMTVKQKTQFLDAVFGHYTALGVELTQPEQRW